MARKIYELVATVSEWQDKQTGKKCKRTLPIGTVFEHPGGRLSAKLEMLPIFPGWSGFVAFRPCAQGEPLEPEPDEAGDEADELPPF
jgi:hypothetical protein